MANGPRAIEMRATIAVTIVAVMLFAMLTASGGAHADHNDNGHANRLYPAYNPYEMNSRTTNVLTVPVRLMIFSGSWAQVLSNAVNNWNSGMSSTTGFNVFTWDNNQPGYLDIRPQIGTGGQECVNPNAHGCYLSWTPSTPSAEIFMYSPVMNGVAFHKTSDLLHELGHALLNANEHYPGTDNEWNCTSLMGHSANEYAASGSYCTTGAVLTIVQPHHLQDYRDAYGVKDAPNATYVQMLGSGWLVHYFEGGYLGGNGKTLHQELYNPPASPSVGTPGTLSVRLIEDINENLRRDDGDAVPAQTVAVLVPWADTTKVIELITAKDGTFAFENIPPGDYSLRLFWPAGFVSAGSSAAIPHLIRAVFRVSADGAFTTPDPLPATWPGLPLEKFDPPTDGTIIGQFPAEIVLKRKDPDVGAVLPGAGDAAFALGVGRIDVGAALRGETPALLPDTGSGGQLDGGASAWAAGGPVVVLSSLAFVIAMRRRRERA
jgi:hypothetical protein